MFLTLKYRGVDVLGGNARCAACQYPGTLCDGQKTQQFVLAGLLSEPFFELAL
ncbi:hypothetical protein D3C80_2042260 [compost metagenome]